MVLLYREKLLKTGEKYMGEKDILEFKDYLKDFEATVKENVAADAEYNGEAEPLLQAITRLKKQFETINNVDDFEKRLGAFGKDFLTVQEATFLFNEMEDEDFDDFDFDDEEDCDEDCDDLEFADSEDER
jgi:hypothetical protein